MNLNTTFRLLREADVYESRYRILARALGGIRKYGADTPIPLLKILHQIDLGDALWGLRCTIEDSEKFSRLLAADFAEHVLPIFEKEYPNDDRPRRAIQAARDYAEGKIDIYQLDDAAEAAWEAAFEAQRAAPDAAWAAEAVGWAADARGVAAEDVWPAASAAVEASAEAAEREWQRGHFEECLLFL